MAHNLYNDNAYIGKQAAWHKLGMVTGEHLSIPELLLQEWMQADYFKSQLHDGLGREVDAWGIFRWAHAAKASGDKAAAVFLGTVGKDYTHIPDREGLATLSALMAVQDDSFIETAGLLGNGETFWALADLGLTAKVGNDVQQGYLLFSQGHAGNQAHTYRVCMTRVVCNNTLTTALGERTKGKLTIKHTKNAVSRIEDAREILAGLSSDVAKMEDKLNFLAGRKLTREALTTVLDRLFPKQKDTGGKDKDTSRRTNILGDILKLYELNDGDVYREQRGTSYSLLNAVTNWTDHQRTAHGDNDTVRDTNRATAALFGSGDQLKGQALEVLMEASKGLPMRNMGVQSVPVDWNDLGIKLPQVS